MRLVYLLLWMGVIAGSAAAAPLDEGTAWLLKEQNPDGSWGRSLDFLSTAFATAALESLGYSMQDERALLVSGASSTEELALAYFATGDAALRDELLRRQESGGGWGGVATTSLVLIALAGQNYSGAELDSAAAYLLAEQGEDGGFGSVKDTALAALALSGAGANTSAVERALNWIEARQHADGGFGYTVEAALASLALALSPEHVNASLLAANYLKSTQNRDGGWGIEEGAESRVYPSALALLALSLHNQSAPEVVRGAGYLLGARHPLGGWEGEAAEGSIVDTAIAIDTLRRLNYSGEALTRALRWLSQQEAQRNDELAWKIIALEGYENVSALAEQLANRQNRDGGWGVKPGYGSDLIDTAFAVEALLRSGYREKAAKGVEFIENADDEDIFARSYGTVALRSGTLSGIPALKALRAGGEWLLSTQRSDGGWGELYSTPLDTSSALTALLVSAYAPGATQRAAEYLLSTQQQDGGWGDVLTIAFALRALHDIKLTYSPRIISIETRSDGATTSVFGAYSDVEISVNYTGNTIVEGYIDSNPIKFKINEAIWNTGNIAPGNYSILIYAVDADNGVIVDSTSATVEILPYFDIDGGSVIFRPYIIDVNSSETVSVFLKLKLKSNIRSNANISYTVQSPNGTVVASGQFDLSIKPYRSISVPLAIITRNFTVPGVYNATVNISANGSSWNFTGNMYVISDNRISAVKYANPEYIHYLDNKINLSIVLRGESLMPDINRNVDVILVIDRSGSMRWDGKIENAKKAAKSFVRYILRINGTRVGVVTFEDKAALVVSLTDNLSIIERGIDSIYVIGSTAIGLGIHKAREHFSQVSEPWAERYILLLSDGEDTASPESHNPIFEAINAKNEGIIIYTVGVGSGSDTELMENIANITGGKFYYTATSDNIEKIYREIAGEISGIAGFNINVTDYLPDDVDVVETNPRGFIKTSGGVIVWRIPELGIGEELNLSFQAVLRNLTPGERVVNRQVNITYLNANGDVVSFLLPEVKVRVLPSWLELGVATDRASYRYGEKVSIAVEVRNAGEAEESALLQVGIYDTQLSPVYAFPQINLSIPPNGSATLNLSWSALSMAGDYLVLATAQNQSASAGFAILPEMNLSAELYSAKQSYTAGEAAELHATLRSLSPNYVFENLLALLSISGENGTAVYSENRTVPLLLPGAFTTLGYLWSTSGAEPGNYTATLEVYHNGTLLTNASAGFSLAAPPLGSAGIEGELNVTPREVLGYSMVNFSYLAVNTGSLPLENLSLVISLVSPSERSMVLNLSVNTSLGVNESISGTFSERVALPREDYLVLFYAVLNSSIIPLDQGYLRVLATPRTLKNDSIAMLSEINTTEKHAQKEILRAIEHIEHSLSGSLWQDDYHLSEKHGQKVFAEEKKAVKHLLEACSREEGHGKHGGRKQGGHEYGSLLSCTFNETVQRVIFNLLLADEVLANASIAEAELALANASAGEKVQREIELAREELGRAYTAIAEKRYAKAIDHFKKAWEHAQHAIRQAEEEGQVKKEHKEGKKRGRR